MLELDTNKHRNKPFAETKRKMRKTTPKISTHVRHNNIKKSIIPYTLVHKSIFYLEPVESNHEKVHEIMTIVTAEGFQVK